MKTQSINQLLFNKCKTHQTNVRRVLLDAGPANSITTDPLFDVVLSTSTLGCFTQRPDRQQRSDATLIV